MDITENCIEIPLWTEKIPEKEKFLKKVCKTSKNFLTNIHLFDILSVHCDKAVQNNGYAGVAQW